MQSRAFDWLRWPSRPIKCARFGHEDDKLRHIKRNSVCSNKQECDSLRVIHVYNLITLICSQQTRDIAPMLGRRRRRRANTEPTVDQCLLFAWLPLFNNIRNRYMYLCTPYTPVRLHLLHPLISFRLLVNKQHKHDKRYLNLTS